MNNRTNTIAMMMACVISLPVMADDTGFEPRWYGGIGAGISRLEPDTNNTGFSVSDDSSSGWKLYAGYDWSDRFSIEGYFADLGESSLAPNGTVEYQDLGVSGLYYFYNNHGDDGIKRRMNLSIFAKAGLGFMRNDSDVPYDRINDAHVMLGAGLEYGFANGIAVRTEAEFYDEDSQFFSISILKRFGEPARKVAAVVMPVIDKTVADKAVAEKIAIEKDSDDDGIVDRDDRCPATEAGVRVDRFGCQIADIIVLRGVQFESGSARLETVSLIRLDEAVKILQRYPDIKVEVAGHTDSQGAAAINRQLSQARANAVREHLISRGIAAGRLSARGYGESRPIADNDSPEGRATNRRVELHILE